MKILKGIFWVVIIILLFIGFVWIAGDKAVDLTILFAFGGFCLILGIVLGLHRAKMMQIEEDRKNKDIKSE